MTTFKTKWDQIPVVWKLVEDHAPWQHSAQLHESALSQSRANRCGTLNNHHKNDQTSWQRVLQGAGSGLSLDFLTHGPKSVSVLTHFLLSENKLHKNLRHFSHMFPIQLAIKTVPVYPHFQTPHILVHLQVVKSIPRPSMSVVTRISLSVLDETRDPQRAKGRKSKGG